MHGRAEAAVEPTPKTPIEAIKSAWWHPFASSSLGGAAGGLLCYPPEGFKKRMQTGQTITLNPREIYRGSTAFATSVMLASVTQMSFFNAFQKLPGYDKDSPAWNINLAIMSGMLGATIGSTPVENIILTQQLNKVNPLGAIRILVNQGILRPWVGLPQLAMREAGFGLTMLYGARAVYDAVLKQTENVKIASAAQIAAGVAGAAITQPFDTMATYRQERNGKIDFKDTVKEMYKEGGVGRFFKGLRHRSVLFTGCALTIPFVEEHIRNGLKKS